jgi:hypothetical protein
VAPHQAGHECPVFATIGLVGAARLLPEAALGVVVVGVDEAAIVNQPGERAHGERAAAEAEQVDGISRLVHTAELAIELLDITAEAVAGRASENPQPFEGFGADAIVIERELPGQRLIRTVSVHIDGFEQLEDVGAAVLYCRVPGAVGADDDVLVAGFHGRAPHAWRRRRRACRR